MKLTRVIPAGSATIDLESADARDALIELYRPPETRWLRLNLITSVSGNAVGIDGTSETLTNRADRAILGVIRSLADAVLVGAASVRTEGYFMPRRAALAIVTASGDLTGHRITVTDDRGPVVVLCPSEAVDAVHRTLDGIDARILELPHVGGVIAAAEIVSALRSAGYESIVCEGGPQLAAHLVSGGLVDEACLSVSPLFNGSTVALFGGAHVDPVSLELTQLIADDASGLYARWAVKANPTTD